MWGLILLSLFGIGVQVNAVTTLKRIPMRYETKLQQSFDTIADSKVFIARLNCPNIMNAKVLACAELPNNWDWNPDHGIVKLSLFNQRNTDNKSLVLNTTDLGPDHVPRECASVKSWSGGDLYVKAWPGTIVPVDYTLSIQVTPANTPARATRRITKKEDNGVDVEELVPIAIHNADRTMTYDSNLLLEMDICLESYNKLTLDTSVLADQGTFSHVICTGPCETPDAETVICKQCNTALPVCICETKDIPAGSTKVFARIHAASGEMNRTSGKFESIMRFGAKFTPQ